MHVVDIQAVKTPIYMKSGKFEYPDNFFKYLSIKCCRNAHGPLEFVNRKD